MKYRITLKERFVPVIFYPCIIGFLRQFKKVCSFTKSIEIFKKHHTGKKLTDSNLIILILCLTNAWFTPLSICHKF